MCHAPVRLDPRHARGPAPPASSCRARPPGARVAGLARAPRRCSTSLRIAMPIPPGTRTASAARRDRRRRRPPRRARRDTALTICTRISGNANPVMAPVAPASSSSSRNTPPSPPKIRTSIDRRRTLLDLGRMRDVLNGVGGSSSLMVRAARNLLRDPGEQPRLHRVARKSADSPARRSRCRRLRRARGSAARPRRNSASASAAG